MAAEEDGGISREAVLNYLDSHPEFAGEYVARERAAQGREGAPGSGLANHWQAQQLLSRRRGSRHFDHHPETAPGVSIFFPRRPLSPARRYNLRKRSPRKQPSREKLSKLNELDLMLELIRDIANELDMTNLCHKILTHVGILTNADRCSLFLVKGSRDNKYLVSRLFDVTPDSSVEQALHATGAQEIRVPFGCGIVGHVAKTKETVNIRNAYEDPRFNRTVDQRTGYHTHSILAMPICSADDEVLGVAQIINKATGGHEFTDKDEEVFRNYLTFCGISIANAQMFEMSITEYKRNQILLQLARNIFEEQTSVDKVVHKIMKDAQDLLKCERCSVFLTEDLHDEQDLSAHLSTEPPRPDNPKTSLQGVEFSKIFDLVSGSNEDNGVQSPSASTVAWLLESGLAKHVASTGEVLNLQNTGEDSRFKFTEEAGTGFRITSALCLPIYNRERKIIGVAQLLNKHNNELFDENDEGMFEAFAIFCGLGIHHTQMYENVCRLMSKQKVALEVLSYHATAREEDVGKLLSTVSQPAQLPAATKIGLYDFRFNDFVMSEDETVQGAVRLFLECDCVNKFRVPYDVLCRWVLSVKKNYRPVTYHNWRHAFNVTQTMFVILKTAPFSSMFSDVETFAMMTASLCHDLDHRGTNNAFQSKIESPLARLYSTSTMEHHHFDHSIMIMNSEGNNIFQSLSDEDYREALSILEDSILSTDLALYFKKRGSFISRAQGGVTDWTVEDNKSLLRAMMMTACDVSAICKPWEVQKKVAELVYSEFFQQGDIERTKLHQKPIDIMDREKKDELPKMQVGFIDSICMPLYKVMAEKWPSLYPLYEGCRSNRDHWQALAQQKATIVLPD